jgi:hypothetical protein
MVYNVFSKAQFRYYLLFLIVLMTMGCAGLNLGEGTDQRLVAADTAITSVTELAIDMRRTGQISDKHWPDTKEALLALRGSMDDAWVSYDTNPQTAAEKVTAIEEGLARLKKRVLDALDDRQVKDEID